MKRTGFKFKPRKPMKRTRLRVAGHSTTKDLKDDIQALLRQLAIKTYGTCVLSNYPETGACGAYKQNGELILQAEHLNSRTHTATFGDMRNILLLCQRHHIFWKPQNSDRYWELVEEIVGKERWAWYQRVKSDKRSYKVDLKLTKIALEQELEKLK